MEAEWTLDPGSEAYWCATHAVEEELYIQAFRPIGPPGTHHALLTVNLDYDGQGGDLSYPCTPGTVARDLVFGAGIGGGDYLLPDGVAIHIPAGAQLFLNLHLFNVDDAALEGTSGVLIQTTEHVEHHAGAILAGTQAIDIPPMSTASAEGSCTFTADAHIVSVFPHMHQLGRRMEIHHEHGDASEVIYQGDFDFTDQLHQLLSPTLVRQGDTIRVRCDYDNPTSERVGYGDTSSQEMCLAGLMHYPALGGFACTP
jgi:hypothetical protein